MGMLIVEPLSDAADARLQVYRWVGHGLDVRAVHRPDRDPLFVAVDIEVALGLLDPATIARVESSDRPDAVDRLLTGYFAAVMHFAVRRAEGGHPALYEIDTVLRLAHDEPTAAAAEFVPWFHELVDTLTAEPLADDDVAPDPHDIDEPLTDDTVWTIAEAARILAADPALRAYGRDTLFQALRRQLGWIARDAGVWVPSATAEADGILQRYRVRDETRRIEPRRVTYPQIRVTRTGLLELHRLLGGVADLALPGIPEPTLLEGL